MKCFKFSSRLLLIILNLNQNTMSNLLHIKVTVLAASGVIKVFACTALFTRLRGMLHHLTWLPLPGDQLQGLLLHLHLLLDPPLLGLLHGLVRALALRHVSILRLNILKRTELLQFINQPFSFIFIKNCISWCNAARSVM